MEGSILPLLLGGGILVYVAMRKKEPIIVSNPITLPAPGMGQYPHDLLPPDDNPANYPTPMCGIQILRKQHAPNFEEFRGVAWNAVMKPFDVSPDACFSDAAMTAAQPFLDSWKYTSETAWNQGDEYMAPLIWYGGKGPDDCQFKMPNGLAQAGVCPRTYPMESQWAHDFNPPA